MNKLNLFLLFLTSLFFVNCSNEQSSNQKKDNVDPKVIEKRFIENDLSRLKLKGNVLKITEESYEVKDEIGTLVKEEKNYIQEYEFNENGFFLIKKIDYLKGDRHRTEYAYNETGDIGKINYFSKDKLYQIVVNDYNAKNQLVHSSQYTSSKELEAKTSYTYFNDNGKLKEKTVVNPSGEIDNKETFSYNNDGQKIYRQYQFKTKVEFDSFYYSGTNMIKKVNEVSTIDYEYKDQGTFIKETELVKESNQLRIRAKKYNAHGNLESFNFTTEDGNLTNDRLTTYEYVYDAEGNWVQQTRFANGVPTLFFERKIEYYNK